MGDEERPESNGDERSPIHREVPPLQGSIRPTGHLSAVRFTPVQIQEVVRNRFSTELRRFPGLPSWVHESCKTLPVNDILGFIAGAAGFAVTAEIARQPWLLAVAGWIVILGLIVIPLDWRAKYLRRVRHDINAATYCTLAIILAFFVIGFQIARPIIAHLGEVTASQGPSPTPYGQIWFARAVKGAPGWSGVLAFVTITNLGPARAFPYFNAVITSRGHEITGTNEAVSGTVFLKSAGRCIMYGPADSLVTRVFSTAIPQGENRSGLLFVAFSGIKSQQINLATLRVQFQGVGTPLYVTPTYVEPHEHYPLYTPGVGSQASSSKCAPVSTMTAK
jgi:hypothetical protein